MRVSGGRSALTGAPAAVSSSGSIRPDDKDPLSGASARGRANRPPGRRAGAPSTLALRHEGELHLDGATRIARPRAAITKTEVAATSAAAAQARKSARGPA